MIARSKKIVTTTVVLSFALTMCGGAALADEEAPDTPVELISAVAPDVVNNALTPDSQGNALTFDADSATVHVPADPAHGVSIEGRDGIERVVNLPVTDGAVATTDEEGIRVYQNNDATQAAVAVSSNSVTFTTILESEAAPTEFSYDYASFGGELRQAADGGVTVWEGGVMLTYFLNPWAYDANGQPVPTHYRVEGTHLIQVVEHNGAGFAYPIVADPTTTFPGSNSLYTKIVEDRNASTGAVTVRVYPGSAPFTRLPRSTVISYYDAIVPSTYQRNNLHDQLACHAYNATFKSPWNLDTWRPDVGYPATVAALCNP